jgi:hypothetical protein
VGGGSKAHDQDPCRRIAESGHRPTPVFLVAEPGHFLPGDALAPFNEPGAAAADDDVGGDALERINGVSHAANPT